MRIALIACPAWAVWAPHPALLLLAASLRRDGHHVDIFDLNIDAYLWVSEKDRELWQDENSVHWETEQVIKDLFERYAVQFDEYATRVKNADPQFIGFSINSGARYISCFMARSIREKMPGVPIVFGGADCFRSETFDWYMIPGVVDALCPGEGDLALPALVRSVEETGGVPVDAPGFLTWNDGRIRDNGDPPQPRKMDQLAPITLEGVDLSRYTLPNRLTMCISRGCINHCTFCSEGNNFRPHRSHSAEYMIDQLNAVLPRLAESGQKPHVNFNDSLINANMRILDRLCDLIVSNRLEFTWGGMAYVREEMTAEFMRKMRRAGCVEICWGIESGSGNVLKAMNKRFVPRLLDRVVRDTALAGIAQYGNLIVGFPGEGPREFAETLLFLMKNVNHFTCMGLPILVPLKNSTLYKYPDKFGLTSLDRQLWETQDGKNTPKIRILRRNILASVLRNKKFEQGRVDRLIQETKVGLDDPEVVEEYTNIFGHFLDICGSYLVREPAVMPLLGDQEPAKAPAPLPMAPQRTKSDFFELKKVNIHKFRGLIEALNRGETSPRVDYHPIELYLELTKRCNLDCVMCSHGIEFRDHVKRCGGGLANTDFPENALSVFDRILPYSAMVYLVGLGEPMLHGRLTDMVRRCADAGAFVWLNSNGQKLTPQIAAKLVDSGLSRFVFSVSAGTRETYEHVHKGAKWEVFWKTVEMLSGARLSRNASWPQLFMNYVVMDENISELPLLISRIVPFEVTGISVKPLVNMGGLLDRMDNPPVVRAFWKSDETYLDQSREMARLLRLELEDHSYRENHRAENKLDGICLHPFSTLSVTALGNVYPCGQGESVGGEELVLGNIRESTLEEIWNGERLKTLRERFIRRQYGGGCRECIEKQLCRLHNDRCDTTEGFLDAVAKAAEIGSSLAGESRTGHTPEPESSTRLWAAPPSVRNLHRIKKRNFYRYALTKNQGRELALNTPMEIFLESSNACNLECVFCALQGMETRPSGRSAMLPPEFIKAVGPYLPGVAAVALHGFGEPLLNRYTVPAATEATDYSAYTEFFTNGMLLHPKRVKELVRANTRRITVSISSPNAEKYEKLYRNGKFHRVMDNLRFLKEEKERLGTKYPLVHFNAIAMRDTLPDLPGLVGLAAEMGVRSIDLKPLVVYSTMPQMHEQRLSYDEGLHGPVLAEARRLAGQLGVELSLVAFERTAADHGNGEHAEDTCGAAGHCPLPFRSMYIRVNGLVKPCCFAADKDDWALGDLKTQTIHEIWNGPRYRELRRDIVDGKVPSVCAHCMEFKLRPPSDATRDWLGENGIEIYDPTDECLKLDAIGKAAGADIEMCELRRRRNELVASHQLAIQSAVTLLRSSVEVARKFQEGVRVLPELANAVGVMMQDCQHLSPIVGSLLAMQDASIVARIVERQLWPLFRTFPERVDAWKTEVLNAVESTILKL
ncbi:MAG: radical SAM protein [Syntrophobacteraceae bacterium]|nr:radical SAM protein [Desulfobacteraceae bacterium]